MSGKTKVVITGGAGYVGSHTVHALAELADKYELVVVDNLESGHTEAVPDGVAFKQLALDDGPAFAALLKEAAPDAVIDFAAYLDVGQSQNEPNEYVRCNVANFKNVLDAMVGANCKLLIKSSTQACCCPNACLAGVADAAAANAAATPVAARRRAGPRGRRRMATRRRT